MSIVHITWLATFAVVMVSGCKPSTRATPTPAPAAVQPPAPQEAAASPAQATPTAPKAVPTEDAKVVPKLRTAEPPPPPPEGMVYVPSGTVHIGRIEERVAKAVQVSPFFIDRTEVTVEAYLKCVKAQNCELPYPQPGCNGTAKKPRSKHPMNCINKERAERYCTKQGKRLPSEAEWQAAAGGADGRMYPWGNDAAGEQLCWQKSSKAPNGTCPVGSYPQGASPYGALDMAGNVEEWTSTENPESTPVSFRIKGGSYEVDEMDPEATTNVRIGERFSSGPTSWGPTEGFRCAKDL
jgi:formylglycine-generating enzyme required for sulfatase activity